MSAKRKRLPDLDPSAFANAAVPVADPVRVATATKAETAEPKTTTRAGKVQVQTWLTNAERKALKQLALDVDKTVEQLLRESVQKLLASKMAS